MVTPTLCPGLYSPKGLASGPQPVTSVFRCQVSGPTSQKIMTSSICLQSWAARISLYTHPLSCPGHGVCVQSRKASFFQPFIHSTLVSACTASGSSLGTGAAEQRKVSALKDLRGSWGRQMNKRDENRDNESLPFLRALSLGWTLMTREVGETYKSGSTVSFFWKEERPLTYLGGDQ